MRWSRPQGHQGEEALTIDASQSRECRHCYVETKGLTSTQEYQLALLALLCHGFDQLRPHPFQNYSHLFV